ncbi:sporulation membrane protein YtaF [Caldalkalibacillus mannanilyticus]|uniref:sporulation membrane protein YtaF n=1 Tax=Caldalkalibacillus mannanilyticus TaxID=1418 RepID=UPI00046A76E6|nr:sporulation membrane protein YtaF [Caldalkalibacillus mannanilyticus]
MVHFVSLLVLAFAVSLDSFGVGITYGMRKVIIPIRSIFIIALCSGVMIIVAMGLGQGMSYFISPRFAEMLGGVILFLIGVWALYNVSRSREHQQIQDKEEDEERNNQEAEQDSKRVWTIEITTLGIVIQILRKPMMADMDRSGVISGMEAFILGIALALDAFGAGIGAALMGYSPWLTAVLIATMSSLFVYIGMKFGSFFSDASWMRRISYLPAIILITFGLLKIL